jgi:hypothetical protein
MTLLILGLAMIGLGLTLAYMAGRDAGDRAIWQAQAHAQYADALAESRGRHPGGRDR